MMHLGTVMTYGNLELTRPILRLPERSCSLKGLVPFRSFLGQISHLYGGQATFTPRHIFSKHKMPFLNKIAISFDASGISTEC